MSLVEELRAKAAEWYEAANNEEATAAKLAGAAGEAQQRMETLRDARDFLAGKAGVESAHRHVEAMHNDAWSAYHSANNEAEDHKANARVYRGYADEFTLAADQLGEGDEVADDDTAEEVPEETAETIDAWRFEYTDDGIVVRYPDRAQGWLSVDDGPQYAVNPGEDLGWPDGTDLKLYDGRGQLRASLAVPDGQS